MWKSLKGYINLTKLNPHQVTEYNFISKMIIEWLKLKGFKRTKLQNMYRNSVGYNFRRRCSVKGCKGAWNLKAKIGEEYAHVFYNEKCQHSSII